MSVEGINTLYVFFQNAKISIIKCRHGNEELVYRSRLITTLLLNVPALIPRVQMLVWANLVDVCIRCGFMLPQWGTNPVVTFFLGVFGSLLLLEVETMLLKTPKALKNGAWLLLVDPIVICGLWEQHQSPTHVNNLLPATSHWWEW